MISRIGAILFFMTVGLYAWAHETGFVLRTPMEQVLARELNAKTDAKRVFRLVEAAIARDDLAEAEMYAEISRRMGLATPAPIVEKLKSSLTPEARLQRSAEEFGAATVSGTGVSEAAIAGAVGAELGTAGDLRDIVLEGSKLASGGNYDQVVLGLSMAGLALGDTGPDAAQAKAAGVWKVAHRNGMLQGELRTSLMDALAQAVAYDELKTILAGLSFVSREEADAALKPIAAKTNVRSLDPFLIAGAALLETVGPAEAVKIAAMAESTDDLNHLTGLAREFGSITRGVAVLTGARQVSDFKTTQTIEEAVQINPVPVAMWTAVLLAMMALGDFKILGSLPRSRPNAPKRMFRRMPVRQLQSLDANSDAQRRD